MSNMVVRTNIFSLNAHRNMKNVGLEQGRASNRLSSGFRINSAADDAAGLAISENMRAQIRGLDQASRNAQDGQAMLLTTEGGLEEIGNMIQRTRELLVQASNDTNTQNQRDMINQEINQLGQEIFSMQQRVEFNTNRVLAMGPSLGTSIAGNIGVLAVDNLRVSAAAEALNANRALVNEALEMIAAMNITDEFDDLNDRQQALINNALDAVVLEGAVITTDIAPDITSGSIDHAAITDFAGTDISADQPGGTDLLATVQGSLEQRISDIEDRWTLINGVRNEMMINANTNFSEIQAFRNDTSSGNNVAWFQVGANSAQGIQFDFEDVSRAVSSAAAVVQTVTAMVANPNAGTGIGNGIEVTPLINQLQSTLDDIGNVRANLGAVQNRMDFTMRSLDISSENLQDSESRVRNADIAREMMRFTMSNVLQQAAVSMLSQANQLPQNLLQLLR